MNSIDHYSLMPRDMEEVRRAFNIPPVLPRWRPARNAMADSAVERKAAAAV
jgi:hypothetical protein